MNPFRRLKDAWTRTKHTTVSQEVTGQIFVDPLCSNYENVYAQVRVLVDELKTVVPYGVGRNGAKLPLARTPELAILQDPNEEMGYMEFMDLLFSTWLTETELNIHVWKNARGAIKGYSVLPYGSRVQNPSGEDYFQVYTKSNGIVTLTRDEVMTLRYSRNPYNISQGVSPASAITIYAQIADVMAQYQKAFFENGATPASITLIKAKTRADFDAKADQMEREYHGAKNKNKTIFLWRQTLDDGSQADEVEIKPIQSNNSTLAIKEIMTIVNEEINKVFGVSPFLMGNDSSAKYDNAELSDRNFTKRRIYPALLSFWSQFQHELERILGGLGYSIQFDLEIPELTDRLKVKSEISEKNVANLTSLINAGATPRAATKALELNEYWEEVAYGIYTERQAQAEPTQQEVKVEVPATETNLQQDSHVCRDRHCHVHQTTDAKSNDDPVFSNEELKERGIYEKLMEILNSAVAEAARQGDPLSQEEIAELKEEITEALIEEANRGATNGAHQIVASIVATSKGQTIAKELGKDKEYKVSDDFMKRMRERVDKLVANIQKEVRDKAKEILIPDRETPLSASEIRQRLSDIMPKDRAELIARNETVYAFRAGDLENAKAIAKEYGLKLKKTWRCHMDDRACPICRAMDGKTVALLEAFPDHVETTDEEGQPITYSWKQNDWNEHGEITSAHPRCRCYAEWEVVYD